MTKYVHATRVLLNGEDISSHVARISVHHEPCNRIVASVHIYVADVTRDEQGIVIHLGDKKS